MKQLRRKLMPKFHYGFDEWTWNNVKHDTRWVYRFHKDDKFQYPIEDARDRIKEEIKR